MERIKQALEKAREERRKAADAQKTNQPHETAPSIGEQNRYSPSNKGISYTQTKEMPINRNNLKDKRILAGFHEGTFLDAYKILRTQVLKQLKALNANTLAITSAGQGEGKTVTAINLAISLSMEIESTVLLVDADLRHPQVHAQFDWPSDLPGLSDYLEKGTPINELLIHPEGINHFLVLPGGSRLPNSSEMLGSPKMQMLVHELSSRYPNRIVIFDLPPVLSAADAIAFSPYVDAALLVVEEGKTEQEELARAIGLLEGTNLVGTVLNKSDLPDIEAESANHIH